MKPLLASIVLYCISIVVVAAQNERPELCKPTVEWTADGRDILVESRGRVLFVAFMELHCPYCHLQLNQCVTNDLICFNIAYLRLQV
jgi:hypothetical protein